MNCPDCGGANRDGARFCTFCGGVLKARCPSCGAEFPEGGRFCDSCGAPAVADQRAEPVVAARKVVTVLFADMTGSTALEETLDAELVRGLIDRFYSALRKDVEDNGGRVVKFTGDGLMAAFGVPEVREDDATRAVHSAVAMLASCAAIADEVPGHTLSLKVGVNTGEVVVIEEDDDVVGDAVNVASRLEGAAGPGEVYVGESTWRLTRGVASYEAIEPLRVKGKAEPVAAYRLVTLGEAADASMAAPFVGRDDELEKLVAVFEDAAAANAARLVTIVGSPGLGKTRLTRELASRLGDRAVVRETRCDPAGSATFAPIAETLREAAGIADDAAPDVVVESLRALLPDDEPDRERIADRAGAILGAGIPGSTEETFWALRRLIETAARTSPRVLVLDDLHWAEPLLLDFVEHLAEWTRDAPVLLVGTGRPELRDIRPSLTEGGRPSAVISLEGLDERATEQLAVGLLGSGRVPDELIARIPASTEGNPLFVRELVRMLVDDGVLRRDPDGWRVTVDVDAIEVPPTIQSLLAARIDRLRAEERTVVELASVVGKEFYRGALLELAPGPVREQVDVCLESLRRKELVEPLGTYWIDEPVFRFHHVLIRDAAYRRLLKETRAELHERVAEWLGRKTLGLLGEHDEVVAFHLEQAHGYKRDLGREDDALGSRAAELLGGAAKRALDRDDLPAAAALAGRALERLRPDDPGRAELLLVRCEALLSMADVTTATAAVEGFERLAGTPRLRAWATCFAGELANLAAPERLRETEKLVAAAAAELAELGDQAGAAKAHTVHASTLARLGRFAECETVLDHALNAARAADDRRRITAVLGAAPQAALWGPNPVSRAGGRCLDIVRLLRITTGSPVVEATSLRCQAVLEAFRGRTDAARRMLRSAQRTLTELGLSTELLEAEQFAGIVELLADDAQMAAGHLRTAYEGSRRAGVDVLAAQSAALLARAELSLGNEDEALALTETSERLGGQDLKASIAWRSVRAELLARRGGFDEADRLAESAVEIAGRTDALIDHGDACRSLAAVRAVAGDAAAARSMSERALSLYEHKGATALASSGRMDRPTEDSLRVPGSPLRLTNACMPHSAAWRAAFDARDWEAFHGLLSPDLVAEDRRRGLQNVLRGEAYVENFEVIAGLEARFEAETIAIRGDRMCLDRVRVSAADRSRSGYVNDSLVFCEVDEDGRRLVEITFDPDDLEAAITELDERYVQAEGAADPLSLRMWREFARAYTHRRPDVLRDQLADDAILIDHRPAYTGTTAPDEIIRYIESSFEVLRSADVWVSCIHALAPRLALVQLEIRGVTDEDDPYELTVLLLGLREGQRFARVEQYLPEQLGAALARLEELRTGTRAPGPSENSCYRAMLRMFELFAERDWAGFAEATADDSVLHDRRRLTGSPPMYGKDGCVALNRSAADTGVVRIDAGLIATRGERLALARLVFVGKDVGSGPFESEVLQLTEIDDAGRSKGGVVFDPDDLEAAFTELDERYLAGEGAAYADAVRLNAAAIAEMNAREFERFRALFAGGAVVVDRTPAARGEMTVDGFVESVITLFDLAPDLWVDVTAIHAVSEGLVVSEVHNHGLTREGAEVDLAYQMVTLVEDGKVVRLELYRAEQLEAALARAGELKSFEELPPAGRHLENRATRGRARVGRALMRGDAAAVAELLCEDATLLDRRSGVGWRFEGRDAVLGHFEQLMALKEISFIPVAVRGDRCALVRDRFESPQGYEVESFTVIEHDEQERLVYAESFDLDDVDAAFAELDARYVAGEGAPYSEVLRSVSKLIASFNERPVTVDRSFVTDDVVFVDHRLASLGEVRGPDAVLEVFVSLREIAPGLRTDVLAVRAVDTDRCVVEVLNRGPTADGGDVEMPFLGLFQVRDGRLCREEMFPIDGLEHALRRFDELAPGAGLEAMDNRAVRATRLLAEAFARRDWDAMNAVYADDVVSEDRRRGLAHRSVGSADLVEQWRIASGFGAEWLDVAPVAVRGERLALVRMRVGAADPSTSNFEAETLSLHELGDDGRIGYGAGFDPDDLDAAFVELDERYAAGEGSAQADLIRTGAGFCAALNARDWDALHALIADDYVATDHRPASLGELRGAEAQVESVKAIVELIPDLTMRQVRYLRIDGDVSLSEQRVVGQTADSGEVDLSLLAIGVVRRGRVVATELFGTDQLDAALVRYDEVSVRFGEPRETGWGSPADNVCVRTLRALAAAFERRDWGASMDLHREDYAYDDRRPGLRLDLHGRDRSLANLKVLAEMGRATPFTVVATRGERLALARYRVGGGGPGSFETVVLVVNEVGPDGRIATGVAFAPDDYDAAFDELDARYLASDECTALERAGARLLVIYNARDWDSLPSVFTDDLVYVDHRPAGLGERRGVRAFAEQASALGGLAGDAARVRWIATHTSPAGASAFAMYREGADRFGGRLEWDFLLIGAMRGDRFSRLEAFPADRLDDAVARAVELAAPPG